VCIEKAGLAYLNPAPGVKEWRDEPGRAELYPPPNQPRSSPATTTASTTPAMARKTPQRRRLRASARSTRAASRRARATSASVLGVAALAFGFGVVPMRSHLDYVNTSGGSTLAVDSSGGGAVA